MAVRMTIDERNAKCAELDHPGATFSPWLSQTWCVCGQQTYPGNQTGAHVACCGGPLDRHKKAPAAAAAGGA